MFSEDAHYYRINLNFVLLNFGKQTSVWFDRFQSLLVYVIFYLQWNFNNKFLNVCNVFVLIKGCLINGNRAAFYLAQADTGSGVKI